MDDLTEMVNQDDYSTPDMFAYMQSKEADKKFWQYHKENPQVYTLFKKFTFSVIDTGRKYYSAMGIIQRIRWHTDIEGKGTFKINNNYTPGYARLFERDHPAYKGFFRMRVLKSHRNKDSVR